MYACVFGQIHFLLAVGRQGKVRVAKWYSSYTLKEKTKLTRDVTSTVFERPNKACNFVEYKGMKIIYRRYDCMSSRIMHTERCTVLDVSLFLFPCLFFLSLEREYLAEMSERLSRVFLSR